MPGLSLTKETDVLSVSDLTGSLKTLMEECYPAVSVTGEISNFKHHSSGHMYFSLKDQKSQLRCIMWKWQNQSLKFVPEDGMQVILRGGITVYEAQGQYQLIAQSIQPAGEGALQIAFEQLKTRLSAEGLFDSEHKQELPANPSRIGVITSPTGAAVSDIIRVLHRRAPWVEIVLWPVRVQGEGSAKEIVSALTGFNQYGKVDVIIVGRGGGSMEDLWAFNEELVVRAIFDSEVPTISAVGHEVDVTLSDFAADVRAPTPSAAAELAVRDQQEILDRLRVSFSRLQNAINSQILRHKHRLAALMSSHGLRRPLDLLVQRSQHIDELTRRLSDSGTHLLENKRLAVGGLIGRLDALNPLAVLERGYSVCRTNEGVVVRDAECLSEGDQLRVKFHRGEARCRVELDVNLPPIPTKRRKNRKVPAAEDTRMDLFND
ncbi:MAG: exodeoxyribonuclease VII large subunit [Candidatus Latescibacteria bacterium]|nr:exodeoxyribonuclease VII large subunit [Candidatus Latescibacterota bacterium]